MYPDLTDFLQAVPHSGASPIQIAMCLGHLSTMKDVSVTHRGLTDFPVIVNRKSCRTHN